MSRVEAVDSEQSTSLTLTFPDKRDWVLGKILEKQAQTEPDRLFLQYAQERALTYAEVNSHVNRLAHGLQELGVGRGDAVLLMLPNCMEFLFAWFAVNKLGAVQVPINTAYRGYFFKHLANTSRGRFLVIDAEYLDRLILSENELPYLKEIVIRGADTQSSLPPSGRLRFHALTRLLEHPQDSDPGVDVRYHDLAAIHFTSGTTGPSKGTMMTHAHCYFLADANVHFLNLNSQDINQTTLPFFHVNAQLIAVYSALLKGAKVVFYPFFSASDWLAQMQASRATITTLLGGMMAFVMKQPAREDDRQNNLRAVWAVPCPTQLAASFRERFDVERTVECYGNTEIGIVTMQSSQDSKAGSCGRSLTDWYDVKVVDPETDEELPPDTPGELVVRAKTPWIIMQGYVGMPEATVDAFRNLWFHTGDILKRDPDGYFYFVDRTKDRIRRRGENIASTELEQVIAAHPAVLECAVVAAKSEHAGGEDEIKVALVLRPDAVLRPEEFIAWCEDRMPYFAVPRFVEFLAALPKTPTNKLRKHELREKGVSSETWDREATGYKLREQLQREKMRKSLRSGSGGKKNPD